MNAAEGLRSQRLLLRPLCRSDTDLALYRALYCDPRVMQHIAAPVPPARVNASFEAACRESAAQRAIASRWSLRRLSDARDIGLLGAFLDPAARQAELGVILLPAHQRAGYGSEALEAISGLMEGENLVDLVWSRHAPGNPGAEGIMQRCGFVQVEAGAVCRWEKRLSTRVTASAVSL